MRFPERFHALAATARLANIPSVAVNVFLGLAIARGSGANLRAQPVALLILSGVGLYLAGNFLNDRADREWDSDHRPERALPRGLFTPNSYLAIALAMALLALCSAGAVAPHSQGTVPAILFCIVLYTWLHKRTAWSVVPMGLCRALLPMLGYAGLTGSPLAPPALLACAFGLFCHIVGLSLGARCESMKPAPAGSLLFARLWFPAAAVSVFFAAWKGTGLPLTAAAVATLPYLGWTVLLPALSRKPVRVFVSNLLAGIPLVDWILLLPLGLSQMTSGSFATCCVVVPPLAFLAGKLLQRLAPAT